MKLRNGWGAQQWQIILLRAGKAGEGLEETGVDREVHVTAGREAGATVKMAGVTVNEIGETVKEDDAVVLRFEVCSSCGSLRKHSSQESAQAPAA
jgi:hypothetical protein